MILPTGSRLTLSVNYHRRLCLPTDLIVRTLWQERYKVFLIMVIFAGMGTLGALLIESEFRSEARIMPEMNNESGDVLKRLAVSMEAIRPDLYPKILQSTPFILYLIDQSVITTDGKFQNLAQFLLSDDNPWFWNQLGLGKTNKSLPLPINKIGGIVCLSNSQQELVEDISERVNVEFDTHSGIITISAKMPDANVAAAVAQLTLTYLTKYVTDYRTEKARHDLRFYRQQLDKAAKRYRKAQFNVFQYNDHHKNVVMLATTIDRHNMEAELTIAQVLYSELSRQFEQAKLNVQIRTPIFKVLEPPRVSFNQTSSKQVIVVILFTVLGLVLGIGYVLVRKANLVGQLRAMPTYA